ncbi:hypothetical protein PC129_g25243 [Phytophthora cactorum]|uniref:Uncharacterized protein n=1 Tax=Phytophthora cactorum TaxID=29920 RepID=A0A8T1H052_9STRA|nr:hypothetical protein PC129_g25243 [Phytophthora cactorum]
MYDGILAFVQGTEDKLARLTDGGDTIGLKVPLTVGDVAFLTEELYNGRSAITGIPTKLVLVRWRRPKGSSMTVLGEGKDIQKCSNLRRSDLVCMTKEEAVRHEKEVFKGKKSLKKVYDTATIEKVEALLEEAKTYEALR